jgi:hypothetical protein
MVEIPACFGILASNDLMQVFKAFFVFNVTRFQPKSTLKDSQNRDFCVEAT